jgi:hypothetical protein
MITASDMQKLSQKAQFGNKTKEEKSRYFKELQEKRKAKRGRLSKPKQNEQE